MKTALKAIGAALIASQLASALFADSPRTVQTLENGWKFFNADVSGAQSPSFDDSAWESVIVPHDWAITKHFDMNIDYQIVDVWADGDLRKRLRTGRTGALPCFGVGWYRLALDIPAAAAGKKVFLEFDGAMSNAKVYVNGLLAGERPFGYASFEIDATPFAKFGQKNIVAVRLENEPESSRWYSGAGLYRNVRAVVKNKTHIAKDGVFITTPKISRASAAVCVKTEVASPENAARIVHKIFAPNGEVVASAESARIGGDVFIDIPNPRLWDIKTPELYTMQTSIFDAAGNELDRDTSRFGVRSIEISRKGGFVLNGKKILIKGVCMHHDMGPIGAATNVSALRRQLELLKEMGCNAIRTSHNPPSPELVNLCDEMGILLEDEAFDEWRIEKCKNGYHKFFEKWHEKDLVDFIKRDRNHPSVAMWSIGNEISDQKDPNGGKTARELVDIAHRTDPTRLVTAGINVIKDAFTKSKIAQELDVMGVNYHPSLYGKLAKDYPEMIFHGSETASTVSSRGVYHFPVKRDNNPFHEDYHVSSYDLESPPWAQPPDEEFAALEDNSDFFGEFVWTGFDYLGEPTPYNPGTFAKSAYFGIIDLAGFKKDRFYLYQSHWNPGVKVLHVLPHWNWDDRKGEQVPVYCYTNYDKAELFVNGESMGVKSKNPKSKNAYERYRIMWDNVVYKAGEIKVVAYDADGKKRDEKIIKTAGAPRTVRITPERDAHPADPKELIYVAIDVVDKDGNFCPRAARFMFVDVKGEGKLRALCNGDQTDQTPFSSNYMKSFSGKLLAVIEPSGKAGDITVNVYGMKLDPQKITIKTSEPLRVE